MVRVEGIRAGGLNGGVQVVGCDDGVAERGVIVHSRVGKLNSVRGVERVESGCVVVQVLVSFFFRI